MTSSMNLLSFSTSALVRSEYSKSIRLSLVLWRTLAENRADVNGHSGAPRRVRGADLAIVSLPIAGSPSLIGASRTVPEYRLGQCDADALQANRLPEPRHQGRAA